jgi:hypothetical protein
MAIPVFLAHGALGGWDEIVFLGVAFIFLVMMGISWVRSRNVPPQFEEDSKQDEPSVPSELPSSEHFTLE